MNPETDYSMSKDLPDETCTGKHRPSDVEITFFEAVARGDLRTVRQNCVEHRFLQRDGVGRLSRDPLRNLKYHFIVTVAVMTRMCIQNGMIEEEAFRLSDYYILKVDTIQSLDEVENLHDLAVLDYTRKMHAIDTSMIRSKPVNDAINYIYVHLSDPMTVSEVAKAAGITPSYLSRLFRRELGISVGTYIHQRKVDTAAHLLKFSDYSTVEIANRLGFSSQSHFIEVFREELGITPKKYREKYGKPEWIVRQDT